METYIESRIRSLRGARMRRAITLEALAKHFKVNAEQLARRYSAERKRYLEDYVKERLWAFSAELLATSNLSAAEVAAWLGFTGTWGRRHFEEQFIQYFHQAPGAFRKSMKV